MNDEALLAGISEGSVLEGPCWSEPVRVISIRQRDDRVEIQAVGRQSNTFFEDVFRPEELAAVRAVPSSSVTFSADPTQFRLALEAQRIGLAYEYDPHFAISVSQIDPLPHQLAAVYDYLKPRDKQGRPICSSSGRIRVQLNRKEKDKTDVADDHSYWGTLKGSWHWNRGYFARLRKDVDAMYGQDAMPITSFECLDANWRYDCFGVSSWTSWEWSGTSR